MPQTSNVRVVLLISKFFLSITNLIRLFILTYSRVFAILVFAAYNCDLQFVEKLSQVFPLLLLFERNFESSDVDWGASVNFNHFILFTKLAPDCIFNLRICWPGLFSSKGAWIVFNCVVIVSIFSFFCAHLDTLYFSRAVFDLLNV